MFYGGAYEVSFGPVKAGRQEFHPGGQGHLRDWSKQELVWLHIFPLTQTGSTRRWKASYGEVERSRPSNRIPALKLTVQQQLDVKDRKDKTGSRTFAGLPAGGRRRTNFELQTYLTSWEKSAAGPGYGPLFQAALGGAPLHFAGGTVASEHARGGLGFVSAARAERRAGSGRAAARSGSSRRSWMPRRCN